VRQWNLDERNPRDCSLGRSTDAMERAIDQLGEELASVPQGSRRASSTIQRKTGRTTANDCDAVI